MKKIQKFYFGQEIPDNAIFIYAEREQLDKNVVPHSVEKYDDYSHTIRRIEEKYVIAFYYEII